MSDTTNRPIFIVGCPRSGTTLLRLMLDAHPNISAGPETGFLTDLEPILGRHWSHLELYGFDRAYWRSKIAAFFSSFQEEYARRRGKTRWAEKTPQYTPHLDFILSIFPSSQFVHIIRDGRDVVTSYQNRWGFVSGLRGVREWRKYVTIAREFGQKLSADQYHELSYERLVLDREMTMQSLLVYLQEPWDAGVLHYMEAAHDVRPRYAAYTGAHRTSSEPHVYASRVGAWQRELNPLLKIAFTLWSGALLKELGY